MACQVSDNDVVLPLLRLRYLLLSLCARPALPTLHVLPALLLFLLLSFFHSHLLLFAKAVLACVYSCSRQLEIRVWRKKQVVVHTFSDLFKPVYTSATM